MYMLKTKLIFDLQLYVEILRLNHFLVLTCFFFTSLIRDAT